MYGWREHADVGGLMTVRRERETTLRRAANYVDRILKGANLRSAGRAADQVRFCVNLKTAKALGIEIPQTVMTRADQVIE